MDKEEFIDILLRKGYKAIYKDNMPIVLAKDREDLARIVHEVSSFVDSTGFNYSWGVSVEKKDVNDD